MRELPNVDDLQVVAEIAEAELAELRKITEAADALRGQHTLSRKSAAQPKAPKSAPLVSVSLTCTGEVVHVHIAANPQVRRAASDIASCSNQAGSTVRNGSGVCVVSP